MKHTPRAKEEDEPVSPASGPSSTREPTTESLAYLVPYVKTSRRMEHIGEIPPQVLVVRAEARRAQRVRRNTTLRTLRLCANPAPRLRPGAFAR